ncbi:MAG: class I SAM-dependent RNA methyltransferase [Spirochaetales bacterium]|nr:class I SAM-dependent RNA methyltransferase [Spirochaetales bacterium]
MQDIITVEIEKLIPGGKGLCRVNGKVVFVPYVLAGETVEIRIIDERKSFSEADLVNVLIPSEQRVKPVCSLYGRCGGCNMQHMTYDAQLEAKKKFASEHLERNAGIGLEEIPVVPSEPFGYRNRVQVHYAEGSMGFREKSGHAIVPVVSCPVASQGINSFLKGRVFPEDQERVTVYGTDEWFSMETEKKDISVSVLNKEISFNSSLFFQSNLSILPELGSYLRKNVSGRKLVDLYCGVGLMSALVEDLFEEIEAVEMNRNVAPYVDRNLSVRHTFHPLSLEKWISGKGKKAEAADTIILDPPRTGLTRPVRKYLSASKTEKILYISCDPATMARDLKDLLADNYEMEDYRLFDFYPQTSHMEAVALLKRKGH